MAGQAAWLAVARAAWQTIGMSARLVAPWMLALAALPFVACGGRVDGALASDGSQETSTDSAWLASASGTTSPLLGIWGCGPSDVWAVGSGTILHHP